MDMEATSNRQLSIEQIWRQSYQGWGSKTYLVDFIQPVSEFIAKYNCQGTLLDVGCGDGNKAEIFANFGFKVTGVDVSESRIQAAQEKNPSINFICQKLNHELPFADNTFDVVFSCGFFQYVEHEALLRECRRVLKPNGHIILIENLKNNPITRIGRGFLKLIKFSYQSYPWNHFTKKEITSLKQVFNHAEVKFFHILTPIAQMKEMCIRDSN